MLYIEDLMETGPYSDSVDGVAKTLIESGIRQAIADSHIMARKPKETGRKPPK